MVDHEAVLLELKRRLAEGKRSWGRDEVLALVGSLEAEHAVDEGELARVARLLESEVEDLIFHRALQPGRDAGGPGEGHPPTTTRASADEARAGGMASVARPSRAPEGAPDEEERDGDEGAGEGDGAGRGRGVRAEPAPAAA